MGIFLENKTVVLKYLTICILQNLKTAFHYNITYTFPFFSCIEIPGIIHGRNKHIFWENCCEFRLSTGHKIHQEAVREQNGEQLTVRTCDRELFISWSSLEGLIVFKDSFSIPWQTSVDSLADITQRSGNHLKASLSVLCYSALSLQAISRISKFRR